MASTGCVCLWQAVAVSAVSIILDVMVLSLYFPGSYSSEYSVVLVLSLDVCELIGVAVVRTVPWFTRLVASLSLHNAQRDPSSYDDDCSRSCGCLSSENCLSLRSIVCQNVHSLSLSVRHLYACH